MLVVGHFSLVLQSPDRQAYSPVEGSRWLGSLLHLIAFPFLYSISLSVIYMYIDCILVLLVLVFRNQQRTLPIQGAFHFLRMERLMWA